MSLQRTPPSQSPKPDGKQTHLPQYSSDPSLDRITDTSGGFPMLSDNITQRNNKRPREENSPPDKFSMFKDEIKDLIRSLISKQSEELSSSITSKLHDITESNAKIDAALSLLTAQNEEYRSKIALLELQSQKDREYISILENKVEELHRTSRKTCVEIKNVPKKSQETREDLIQMVLSLSKSINHSITDHDITDIFRLKPRGDEEKKPTIILELKSTILRTDLLKKVKDFNIKNKTRLQAKQLGFTSNEDTPIFITEQLTPKGARLFFLARDLKKAQKVKYCWTSMGKVLVRKDDTSKIIHIQHESQVQQLMREQ
uniref:FP protein C-terminal domain-containing protein n=1 Tax=Heliothis virescens TaxID=7102 RepID=A0A2A4J1S2_HELVI